MRSVPLGDAKHGPPAAVLMSADDLESLQETGYWLSQPGIRDHIAVAEREYSEGTTVSGEQLRNAFGLPPKVAAVVIVVIRHRAHVCRAR